MKVWLSIPHDPLIFQDGRPFTAAPGAEAVSLPFPFPSTVAGAVRTMAGTDPETGEFQKERIDELLQRKIRGPILVELGKDNDIRDWLFPAPMDALLLRSDEQGHALRLVNRPIMVDESLSKSTDLQDLSLVGPKEFVKEKPHPNPPTFWRYEMYKKWLIAPEDGQVSLEALGITGLQREQRLHPGINPDTQSAQTGILFRTSGLEFFSGEWEEGSGSQELSRVDTFGLATATDADLRQSLGFLGGERRAVSWKLSTQAFPDCPEEVKASLFEHKACRLILLTPAYFSEGYLPSFDFLPLQPEVTSAAVRRYQTVSGWDYAKHQPKPTQRLAPSGSVYFLRFDEDIDEDDLEVFVQRTWMQTVSDTVGDSPQKRRDGFGLAALGTWDGELKNMEVMNE